MPRRQGGAPDSALEVRLLSGRNADQALRAVSFPGPFLPPRGSGRAAFFFARPWPLSPVVRTRYRWVKADRSRRVRRYASVPRLPVAKANPRRIQRRLVIGGPASYPLRRVGFGTAAFVVARSILLAIYRLRPHRDTHGLHFPAKSDRFGRRVRPVPCPTTRGRARAMLEAEQKQEKT